MKDKQYPLPLIGMTYRTPQQIRDYNSQVHMLVLLVVTVIVLTLITVQSYQLKTALDSMDESNAYQIKK